jgi:hypothetical protein
MQSGALAAPESTTSDDDQPTAQRVSRRADARPTRGGTDRMDGDCFASPAFSSRSVAVYEDLFTQLVARAVPGAAPPTDGDRHVDPLPGQKEWLAAIPGGVPRGCSIR